MSAILYQNADCTITLIDIPRSIELAQGITGGRRIISSESLKQPYKSVEPKTAKAVANLPPVPIQDLLLQRHLQFVLDEVQGVVHEWCLPRVLTKYADEEDGRCGKKRLIETTKNETGTLTSSNGTAGVRLPHATYEARDVRTTEVADEEPDEDAAFIPIHSQFVHGNIEDTKEAFMTTAPTFDLVIMDPPWPNRSARRKKSYVTSYDSPDIARLLSSIPINEHLNEDGRVGVWLTNKPVFRELLLGPEGMFERWGLELVEEWVWLKVTASGEPICELGSSWRKPYETLLLGQRTKSLGVKRRVLLSVPDVHSRKPNLKDLFDLTTSSNVLEVFARNLTAGWWAWGNEVLQFQQELHWVAS